MPIVHVAITQTPSVGSEEGDGGGSKYLFVPCNRLLFCAELVCDS